MVLTYRLLPVMKMHVWMLSHSRFPTHPESLLGITALPEPAGIFSMRTVKGAVMTEPYAPEHVRLTAPMHMRAPQRLRPRWRPAQPECPAWLGISRFPPVID
jgi:hypothetical protein